MQDPSQPSQTSPPSPKKSCSTTKHTLTRDKLPLPKKKTQVYSSPWFEKLVACIGFDATRKLLTAYGGKTITLPRPLVFFKGQRDVMITKDYLTGKYSKVDLAAKWGLTTPTITKIIEEIMNDPKYQNWLK